MEPSRTKSINARGLKLGRSDGSTAKHVRYSSHFCGKRILGCTTHQKMVRKEVDSEQPSRTKSIKSRGLTLGAGRNQTVVLPNACGIRHISATSVFWGCTPTKRCCERRVAVSRVQDSSSTKPRFRNTNLLISHVLDSCVKLLAVLHVSSA